MEKLVLVDKKDRVLGYASKEECHKGKGLLHRAFSIYVFDKRGRLLIQQRSEKKKLWPLFWSNTCCSHPRKGEDYIEAGERRLKEEMGFSCSLQMVDKFYYYASFKKVGSEKELCAILVGEYNGSKIKVNPKEVNDYKWVNVKTLFKDFKKNPQKYTPWFKMGLKLCVKAQERNKKLEKEFKNFSKNIAQKIYLKNKELLSLYVDKKFQKAVNYQNLTGGKRLRPILTVLSSKVLGGSEKDVLYPAAGLEILHNCTLIIDDIIDHSSLRRQKPTVWYKFGTSFAQCASMYFLGSAFLGANRTKNRKIVSEIFAKTIKTIMDGELYDILFEQSGREDEPFVVKNRFSVISEKDYQKMISKKTAFLFSTCCEVGAICAGGNKREITALKNYGFNLGMAFQIQDDILDIFGDEKTFGKKIGKDIEEKKIGNIVIFYTLKEISGKEKKSLLNIFKKGSIKEVDIKNALKIIKSTRSKELALKKADKYLKKAKECLSLLPKNKYNHLLAFLTDFLAKRKI